MDEQDELGAHVSAAGGVENAPGRAREIGCVVLQLFTKQAQRWHEPELGAERTAAFRSARADLGIGATAAHDSYLINLASPDPALRARSLASFIGELRRSTALGLDYVVTIRGTRPTATSRRASRATPRGSRRRSRRCRAGRWCCSS
jgi:deoxyribonuclease-4